VIRPGRLAVTAQAAHLPGFADDPACDPARAADLLGRKGLLAKEPATRLALCAVHRALGRPARAPKPTGPADPDTAVVVGSNLGNVGTVSEIARQLRDTGPRSVSPLEAPNASSNVIASTVAIWFRFGGPNLTVCSGATAGLDALWVAALLLRARRANRVVVVAAEPDDPDAVRVHAMRRGGPAGVPLRAGAGCVVVEPVETARDPLAVLYLREVPGDAGTPAVTPTGDFGDTYGAAGLIDTCLATARVAADPAAGPVRVVCGDPVDGWRELFVRSGP
jgi:3-oxoacyl-[acyl-carrier-protein] synthase II